VTVAARRTYFLGLFCRKERWGLTVKGWLLSSVAVMLLGVGVFFGSYPFLAITHPVQTNILVVEGWVHGFAIRAAVEEFRKGSYRHVYTTGGPIEGSGGYSNDFNTSASVAADSLRKNGLPTESLEMVPSRESNKDRTYSSALALREWLLEHDKALPDTFNVITEAVHARRSRLLYEKAFGPRVEIGIISVPPHDYPYNRWWRYSEGVKEVISEGAGYVYARFFFWP
jgi:hypothetical protein